MAVIQRSAFRDEGSLFDFHFLPSPLKRKPRLQINLPVRRPRRIRPARQRIRHSKKSRKCRRRRIRRRRTQHRARRPQIHIVKNVSCIHAQRNAVSFRRPRTSAARPAATAKGIPPAATTAAATTITAGSSALPAARPAWSFIFRTKSKSLRQPHVERESSWPRQRIDRHSFSPGCGTVSNIPNPGTSTSFGEVTLVANAGRWLNCELPIKSWLKVML